ncbi:hypothetical protein BY996DRAFT_147008 [Phakopsora pachyrhizi]|nr:hypothetical protein BY996DRAFT_147008 [Phakopsora pachyrhizi]
MNFEQFKIPEPMINNAYNLDHSIGNDGSLTDECPNLAPPSSSITNLHSEAPTGSKFSAGNEEEIKNWVDIPEDSNYQMVGEKVAIEPQGSSSGQSTKKPEQPCKTKPTLTKPKGKASSKKVTVEEIPEAKKSWHKVAEQRRRDSLKMCFEELRRILPPIKWESDQEGEEEEGVEAEAEDDDDNNSNERDEDKSRGSKRKEGSMARRKKRERRPGEGNVGGQRNTLKHDPERPNKGISKVTLLRKSNEFIMKLNEKLKLRDRALEMMSEIMIENDLVKGLGEEYDQKKDQCRSDDSSSKNKKCKI